MDQRKTVLLADAGEEFRTLLWEEMEKTGEFSVEIARDGNEILKRVKERMPDLLVMDVMLPGMDGISVLRHLRRLMPGERYLYFGDSANAPYGERSLEEVRALSMAAADRLLKQGTADFTLVDFHAEATSEKLALGYYLDGRVSALWGTHTHVPTADERVYPKGTGYITDLGMTGPIESVLGVESAQSVESFLGGLPGRYRSPDGPCKLQGAIFTLDSATGLCTAVERVDIR